MRRRVGWTWSTGPAAVPPVVTITSAAERVTALCRASAASPSRLYGDDLGAQRAQPGREHRAERVPDQTVSGGALGEQLVAEDEDFDARAGDGGEGVVPGGRGEAQDGRGDEGAGRQELVAAAALLSARADVLAVHDLAGGVQ